eukprot:TRINITY_DN61326_c0_g1_i1.p1 TRINITY_DN61326_c0_g1~~TRINITY_DN61326_c0_g1_i1.p1  ORF type:complete len:903 (+),score=182.54 TRINITY_DN61326_c0_g1_i1:337-2709(+)
MVKLKRKYPGHVHLLLGNRDINKMKLTSEIDPSELKEFRHVQAEKRSDGRTRPAGKDFIAEFVAKRRELDVGAVTDKLIDENSTAAIKLQYIFNHRMNSKGEFEFRRQELAELNNCSQAEINDDEVAASYKKALGHGGWTREYLRNGQLGILIGDALFVHGQIIGNDFNPAKTRYVDKDGVAWSVGVVPDREEREKDVKEWLKLLNDWGRKQVQDWEENPTWYSPPTAEGRRRGGEDLMNYGEAHTKVPSVIYCRWLTQECMPLPYPQELSEYLEAQDIRYVVVGHTPHGNAPTLFHSDGVTVVMCDTSYSKAGSNTAFKGDNRGQAVSVVSFQEGLCSVKGRTHTGQIIDYTASARGQGLIPRRVLSLEDAVPDEYVGNEYTLEGNEDKFFIKARLPTGLGRRNEAYILCNIKKFIYRYAVLEPNQLPDRPGTISGSVPLTKSLSGCGRRGHIDPRQVLEHLFSSAHKSRGSDKVSKSDLAAACTKSLVRSALTAAFPGMSMDHIFTELSADPSGCVSLEEFCKVFDARSAAVSEENSQGIYFEVIGSYMSTEGADVGKDFPASVGPFLPKPTVAIKPSDLKVSMRLGNRPPQCELQRPDKASWGAGLRKVLDLVPEALLHAHLTPLDHVSLSQEERAATFIPADAVKFAWCYPFLSDWGLTSASEEVITLLTDPDVVFLTIGGYVYFDSEMRVVQINGAMPDPRGILKFGRPKPWRPEWTQQLKSRNHFWHPTTLQKFIREGAMEYSWLQPHDFEDLKHPDGSRAICKFGAFAYLGNLRAPADSSGYA